MQCLDVERGRGSLFIFLLDRSIKHTNLKSARAVHAALVKTAFNFNVFIANKLIEVYAKCDLIVPSRKVFNEMPERNTYTWNTMISGYARSGLLRDAHQLFEMIPERNLVTWNAMISGLSQYGEWKGAIDTFRRLQKDRLSIDKFTLVSMLNVCAGFAVLQWVRQIHGAIVITGLKPNLIMLNAFVDAYGKCGDLDSSQILFDRMEERDVVSWTSILSTHAQFGRLDEARKIFEQMPEKNAVSWTAMITGHAQNDEGEKALNLFATMQRELVRPSAFTLVGVLNSCSSLALIEYGKQLHAHIMRTKFYSNLFIANALIDMYAKCGNVKLAVSQFEEMSERDVISWNALVTGFAQNGYARESLQVFQKMLKSGVRPNQITFLGVLVACSYSGLLSDAHRYLRLMETEYWISPRSAHYAVMIDLLGRSGRLHDAMELIKTNNNSNRDVAMWGALLGACQIHGNVDLAREAADNLFFLEPANAARYVSLSNVYADARRWKDVSKLRVFMKEKGIKKQPGFSWIQLRNTRYYFVAEDESHGQIEEIYQLLNTLTNLMMEEGYLSELPIHHEKAVCGFELHKLN